MVRVGGTEIVNHEGKTLALTEYFTSIIGVPVSSVPVDLDSVYAGSASPSDSLTEPFSESEAKLALWSMNMNSVRRVRMVSAQPSSEHLELCTSTDHGFSVSLLPQGDTAGEKQPLAHGLNP